MRAEYGKLVRDGIPAIIARDGRRAVTSFLRDGASFRAALLDKLVEEAQEARDATRDSLLTELADVYEVVTAIAHETGIDLDRIAVVAAERRSERGGFEKRLWLHYVDDD